jgi:hypothetical protein
MTKESASGFTLIQWLIMPLLAGSMLFGTFPIDNPTDSRKGESSIKNYIPEIQETIAESDSINSLPNIIYYSDSFNGANDTTSLKNRGYKLFYRGTGPQGLTATWFQGSSIVFPALNGPTTGYAAANFNAVTSQNNIDNWLILPSKSTVTGDSLFFFSRSILNSRFPDSIRVMFSQSGDSVPEAVWTEVGRFKVSINGSWQKKGFRAPSTGSKARFAIRYNVVNGGPSGINSDYVGIDSLTIERPIIFPNNMQAVSVISPIGTTPANGIAVAPSARFVNIGSNSLTNVSVSFRITGPVNYNSTKIIAGINSGDSVTVKFDSTFVPTIGSYTAKAFSSLANDTNRLNDTISLNFSAVQTNFGSGAGYFFSNSVGTGAPSKPEYCLQDTSGSMSLIVNGQIVRPDIFTGTTDNGYFRLGNFLQTGRKINFGNAYDSIFVGTNGVIGFTQQNVDLKTGSPDTANFPFPAFFPMWADINFGSLSMTLNRLSVKFEGNSLVIINYDRALIKSGSSTDYVSFQVMIDILDEYTTDNSRILVQYTDTTYGRTGDSFMTKYFNGSLQTHLVGLALSQSQKLFYRYAGNGFAPIGGPLLSASPVSVQFGPDVSRLIYSCSQSTLNLQASLEAMTPDSPPSSNSSDTLMIQLREQVSPYEPVDVKKAVLSNTGNALLNFDNIKPGRSYYIIALHRNSIETWSSIPVLIPSAGSTISYNFTTGVGKAFGNNMVIVQGAASFFAGDVNLDYSVDGSDLSRVDNDASAFQTGYIPTDVNNDDIVDGTDAQIVDNNAANFVNLVRP